MGDYYEVPGSLDDEDYNIYSTSHSAITRSKSDMIGVFNLIMTGEEVNKLYKDESIIEIYNSIGDVKAAGKIADSEIPANFTDTDIWQNLMKYKIYHPMFITHNYLGAFSSESNLSDAANISNDANSYGDKFSPVKDEQKKIAIDAFHKFNDNSHKVSVYWIERKHYVKDLLIEIETPFVYKDDKLDIGYKSFIKFAGINQVMHEKEAIIPIIEFMAFLLKMEPEDVVKKYAELLFGNHIYHGNVGKYYNFDDDYIRKYF